MSRTWIVAAVIGVLSLLNAVFAWGLNIEQLSVELANIVNAVFDWGGVIVAAVMVWLRKITGSPMAQGLAGWFGVKE